MASCVLWPFALLIGLLVLSSTGGRAGDNLATEHESSSTGGGGAGLRQSYVTLSGCDAVVANITDICRDFVVGKAPPSPGPNGPCCKTLRGNRQNLSCLCGRVNFAKLNQKNLVLTSLLCAVPFNYDKCRQH